MRRSAESSGSTFAGSRSKSESYTWRNVVIIGGGFVSGIIFSREVDGLVYARTDVGGAYRRDPGSETWQPLLDWVGRDEAHYLGVESLALDPTDPDRVYLAVGLYTKDWAGAGAMLRSKDRGRTWKSIDMSVKMGGNEWGRACGERLAVDPNQPSHVFFGSRQGGLLVSGDHGETWEKRPGLPAGTGNDPIGITAIVFDAKSGKPGLATPVIYAAVDQDGGSVMQSRDAGMTWATLKGQPKGMLACHIELDELGKLWATYGNGPGPNDVTDGAVYTLDPKGGTAKDVSPLKPSSDDKFGYAGLAVDHTQPGRLLVTTIDRWTHKDEIFFTKDAGKTWRPLVKTARWDVNGAHWAMLHRDTIAPWWMGDIDLDPFDPNHAKISAGIWSTTNLDKAEASEPVEFRLTNHGIEESVTNVLVSPPEGAPLLSGVKDFCGLRHERPRPNSPRWRLQSSLSGNLGTRLRRARAESRRAHRDGLGLLGKAGAERPALERRGQDLAGICLGARRGQDGRHGGDDGGRELDCLDLQAPPGDGLAGPWQDLAEGRGAERKRGRPGLVGERSPASGRSPRPQAGRHLRRARRGALFQQ